MSDEAGTAAPTDGVTAGMLLRRAREAAGLHVATLAVALKVPVRKLEALEEDRYDQLSDAVFVRALASSVCRTLKVDPQPVLERLPQSSRPRLMQPSEGINAPFRAPGDGPSPKWSDQITRPVGLIVVGLLLAALVIAVLPTVQREAATVRTEAVTQPNVETVSVTQVQPAPSSLAASSVSLEPDPAAASASVPVATLPAPAESAASAAVPTAPASTASTAASAPEVPSDGTLVFRTAGDSWVQVTDASGTTVLRQLMRAGETASATGKPPLSVTVGSAPSTQVLVRGKPFDLGSFTKDNVARFEVR